MFDRLEHDAFDRHAADEGDHDRDEEGEPVGHALLDQLPGDESREHRHFALGEVQMVDCLVNHHDGERHAGVNRARRNARQDLLEKKLHTRDSSITEVGATNVLVRSDLFRGARHDDRAGFEEIGVIRDAERERRVLLDDEH